MALPPQLKWKSVSCRAPPWVGGVNSYSTPKGAQPTSYTTKALLPSNPSTLLHPGILSPRLSPMVPALTQNDPPNLPPSSPVAL